MKKKLFPNVKLISFNENHVSNPLCKCDFHIDLKCNCDLNYETCTLDSTCSYVKRKCIDLPKVPPPCICDSQCTFHREDWCSSDLKIPISEELPNSCESYSTYDKHVVSAFVTIVSKKGVEKYEKKIDLRTGESIKE